MRTNNIVLVVLGLAASTTGCVGFDEADNCGFNISLPCYWQAVGGSGGGTTTSTIDPGCIPSDTPNPVRDDCGIFVSSAKGDDAGTGTKAKPYKTIAAALVSPKGGPIYLCAETFPEPVKITSGRTIYGGLDCATDWGWSAAKKSEVQPAAGKVPLVVDPTVGFVVADVAWRAKDASEAGGSSIAVIVTSGANVSFTRCDVEAGNGKDGAPGEAFATSASAGAMGNAGADACASPMIFGGGSVANECDDGDPNDDSISGKGGSTDEFSGGDGSNGSPGQAMNAGAGEDANNPTCSAGQVGDNGAAGTSATGASGAGTISAQGYAGVAGSSGEKGKPAQGGGGGGGAKGGAGAGKCTAPNTGGASGGSGGSGGCGGAGGRGGQAGGASIGIVSIDASLTFDNVTLTTKAGGKGGPGGDGQLGGMGGAGAPGGTKSAANNLKDGCAGGPGGTGGKGGKGGGGLGGASIGIAHTGDTPDLEGVKITIGAAGDGGAGDGDMGAGAKGVAAQTQAF